MTSIDPLSSPQITTTIVGSANSLSSPVYDETRPETTQFESTGSGVFDDEDEIEMVPVTVGGWGKHNDSNDQYKQTAVLAVEKERPSNERLLTTAFCTFFTFTICQSIAAFVAGSEAMVGDSAAMMVDSLTYLFNLVAERRKSRFEEFWKPPPDFDPAKDRERAFRIKKRAKRKMILTLELVPPLVSVSTLVIVTGVVLHQSISILILDVSRDKTAQADVNVNLMLIFSLLNLVLDVVNVFCFAKANRLLGYQTSPEHPVPGSKDVASSPRPYAKLSHQEEFEGDDFFDNLQPDDTPPQDEDIENMEGVSLEARISAFKQNGENNDHDEVEQETIVFDEPDSRSGVSKSSEVSSSADTEPISNGIHVRSPTMSLEGGSNGFAGGHGEEEARIEEANLNMCSAYTHVFADTLRSLAVVIAAGIAEISSGVTSEEVDAAAAVVVSVLILLSLIPLFRGLCVTFGELQAIAAEERSEKMFSETSNGQEIQVQGTVT